MRVIYLLLSFMLCFYPVTQAQNTTNQFMTQAQSSLEKKDYTKARYLFLQAYKSLSQKGDYKQAIDAGTQAAYLYYRENYYQEAFDLCRQMNQFILTEEQKLQKSLYEQRFQVTKERLEKDRAAALQGELDKAQEATVNAEKFMSVVRKYLSIEELTHTLLREMVEKIVVYECEYDENEVRRQRIDIYYSFVGKIDLPEE